MTKCLPFFFIPASTLNRRMNAYPNEDSCVLITKMECSSPPCLQQQSRQKCSSYGYFSSLFWRYYCNTFMCFLSRTAFLQIRVFFFFTKDEMRIWWWCSSLPTLPCDLQTNKRTKGAAFITPFDPDFFFFPLFCCTLLWASVINRFSTLFHGSNWMPPH